MKAKSLKSGRYEVVLDPSLASCIIHEAVGHMSEGDEILSNVDYKARMVLNRKVGIEQLNIVDDGTICNHISSCKYDNEGVPTTKTYLIRNGHISSHLHSRETAGEFGAKLTGNARALDYNFPPLVRMWTTYLEPGDWTFEEMIGSIKPGSICENKERRNAEF